MGDVADMMLDGTLCEGCGVFIDEENISHVPRLCRGCEESDRLNSITQGALELAAETHKTCRKCGKRVKWAGLNDHLRDKHGVKSN